MKVQATYKGKTVEIDIPDEKLEELVNEQKKTGWEKPKVGMTYWYVTAYGTVENDLWSGATIDERRYDCGNYFTSKELAENIARYQSLDLRIRRRIAEICEPVDWKNTTVTKYGIYYHYNDCRLDYYLCAWGRYCPWHCDTEEHARQIIEEFKDELIWYFTEFKDRMDG